MAAGALRPSPFWRAHLLAAANRPPQRQRLPLSWRAHCIGSVEPDLFERAGIAGQLVAPADWRGGPSWEVLGGDLSAALAQVAFALRDAGLAHTWRDEPLPVRDTEGTLLGAIERALVRPLGIETHAVHLAGFDPRGWHWVQRRAFDKPTDPGLWDTLVGGLVPAGERREHALERETWEEAGLRIGQMQGLRYGGRLHTRRPFRELAHGYVVEAIDWYVALLPGHVAPENQDGEVVAFRCMAPQELTPLLQQEAFTIDASLVLLAAFGAP